MNQEVISALERPGSISILLTLLERKQMKTRDLISSIPVGQNAFYTAIRGLLKANLVTDKREGYPLARIFTLTKKGEVVARKIKEMLAEIENLS